MVLQRRHTIPSLIQHGEKSLKSNGSSLEIAWSIDTQVKITFTVFYIISIRRSLTTPFLFSFCKWRQNISTSREVLGGIGVKSCIHSPYSASKSYLTCAHESGSLLSYSAATLLLLALLILLPFPLEADPVRTRRGWIGGYIGNTSSEMYKGTRCHFIGQW